MAPGIPGARRVFHTSCTRSSGRPETAAAAHQRERPARRLRAFPRQRGGFLVLAVTKTGIARINAFASPGTRRQVRVPAEGVRTAPSPCAIHAPHHTTIPVGAQLG